MKIRDTEVQRIYRGYVTGSLNHGGKLSHMDAIRQTARDCGLTVAYVAQLCAPIGRAHSAHRS